MCIRFNSCCGISLRKLTFAVGIWTALQSLALIFLGGWYLYESFKTGNYGTTHFERLPYRFETYRAVGALYLVFGAIWLVITMAYAAAYMTWRALWFLPWLIFEAINIPLALANMLSTGIGFRDPEALVGVPFILISVFIYPIVFSYYLELQDEKSTQEAFGESVKSLLKKRRKNTDITPV